MPKENTHLFFAHGLCEQEEDEKLQSIIKRNLKYFYFGSVAPDLFYYSASEKVRKIAENLHGRYGNPTNELVFELLDNAKESKSEADLAFALGFLTHCGLDITFHPIIYYLSGNYYDTDPKKAEEAVYLHRHLETYLDHKLNHAYFYSDLIKYKPLRNLAFSKVIAKKFNVSVMEIERTIKRKSLILKLLKSDMLLNFLYFCYRPGFLKHKNLLGIFYGNLKRDKRVIPEKIEYRDVINGDKHVTDIYHLFNRANNFTKELLSTAFAYYQDKIDIARAKEIIRGESLNTGKLNTSVTEIKYFLKS